MKVGEIVTLKTDRPYYDGKQAFIEEIIIDPDSDFHKGRKGLFSLYGLEPINGNHYYYGDWPGYQLVATGKMISVPELEEYRKNLQGGFANDMTL